MLKVVNKSLAVSNRHLNHSYVYLTHDNFLLFGIIGVVVNKTSPTISWM